MHGHLNVNKKDKNEFAVRVSLLKIKKSFKNYITCVLGLLDFEINVTVK